MRVLGVSAAAGVAAATQIWILAHCAVFFLMLIYIEPPVNRDLWVADVHLTLWLQVLAVWLAAWTGSAMQWPAVFFAVLDVVITSEMDHTYMDMARTAVTVRAMMFAALTAVCI